MPLKRFVTIQLLLKHQNRFLFHAQLTIVSLMLLNEMLSKCFYSWELPCNRVSISLALFFAQKTMQSYLSLDFAFDMCLSIYNPSFWVFYPLTLPIVNLCMCIICDQNSLTCLFASWAFFVPHLKSLFEHACPADQIVVTFFRYTVILYLTSADKACWYFFLVILRKLLLRMEFLASWVVATHVRFME